MKIGLKRGRWTDLQIDDCVEGSAIADTEPDLDPVGLVQAGSSETLS